MKKSLLLFFAAFAPLVASAQTKVEIDGIWYNLFAKVKQAEVVFKGSSYYEYKSEYSGSITIPATITHEGVDYSVTSIGDEAFRDCYSLTAITIPEGVTSIGKCAFYGCSSLTTTTLPDGVTILGSGAFYACSNLTTINIPDGVTSIGSATFNHCTSLITITISEDSQLTSIEGGAFYGCSSLTAINIPEGVTSIGGAAFCDCSSLTFITIPESVTSIGDMAFGCCSNLTSITLPKGVTSIGDNTFAGCSSLTTITIPEGVTSIGGRAFSDCSRLATITIPEGVTSIGSDAFSGCSSLTTITIPEGVTSLGDDAFRECSSLATITLPEGVTSIGRGAFYACSSLASITIPESVMSIGESAFSGCSSLTSITLPEGVTSLGDLTFLNCYSLRDMFCYAKNVPSAGRAAFSNMPSDAVLYVPASAADDYKAAAEWSRFSKVETFEIAKIVFEQQKVTLIEGEILTLDIKVAPSSADRNLLTWTSSNDDVAMVNSKGKVVTMGVGTAIITVAVNDNSGVSASCEVRVVLGRCATPAISYADGKLLLACDTEGAEVVTNAVIENNTEYRKLEFEFTPTITFTAIAIKEQYEESDVATITLCWVPCIEDHESEEDGILTIPAHPVLIQCSNGVITLTGLTEGAEVIAYSTAGQQLGGAAAANGTATISTCLTTGDIAIVKIGSSSIKIVIR